MGNELSSVQDIGRDYENGSFQHAPLSRKYKQIRILHLPRREDGHDLLRDMCEIDVALISNYMDYHCTTEVVSLTEKPKYQALSYTWGSPQPTCRIMIDKQPFWIARNLATALHHLTAKSDMTLWIDAICIKQKDSEEKSWQIELMANVYKQAESVVVWLGERTIQNMSGFENLRRLTKFWEAEERDEEVQDRQTMLNLESKIFGPPDVSHSREGDSIGSISALLCVEYWSRIWVVQEMACASAVYFACGYDMLESKYISNFLDKWDRWGGYSTLLDHRPWALFEVRSRYKNHDLTIKDILQISSKAQLQATVPKDQIIGFSALVGSRVDYSHDYVEVFTDAAKTLVKERHGLWILSFCVFAADSELPSWVPDWSRQPGLATILQAAGAFQTGTASPFCASESLNTFCDIEGWDSQIEYLHEDISPKSFEDGLPKSYDKIILLTGMQIDVVLRVGNRRPIARFYHLDDEVRQAVLTWFRVELPSLLTPPPPESISVTNRDTISRSHPCVIDSNTDSVSTSNKKPVSEQISVLQSYGSVYTE